MRCVLVPTGGRITQQLIGEGEVAVLIYTASPDSPADVARSACEALRAGASAVAVCTPDDLTTCEVVWAAGAPTRRTVRRDPGSDELPI